MSAKIVRGKNGTLSKYSSYDRSLDDMSRQAKIGMPLFRSSILHARELRGAGPSHKGWMIASLPGVASGGGYDSDHLGG